MHRDIFTRGLLIIAVILFSIPAPARGGSAKLEDSATLQDYLEYARQNNPGLQAARSRWQAARQKIPQVTSLPEPHLSYAYFIEEVETRVGPQQQRIGLRQMFPFPGKLGLRGEIAGENARALYYSYETRRQSLYYRVKSSYSEYYYLGRAIAITRDNKEILKNLEEVLRSRYATNQASYSDLIKVQVELGKLDDRMNSLLQMRPAVLARFNSVLNREPETEIPFPSRLGGGEISFSQEELQRMARQVNPELTGIRKKVEREQVRGELARKSRYPDFSLGIDYIRTGEARMPGVSDSGKDPVVAMINIELPLWRGKYDAEEQQALESENSFLQEAEEKENRIISELRLAYYRYQDANRRISLFNDTLIPKAEQSFRAARTAFEAEQVDFMNLLDAQRQLLEFSLALESARRDRLIALARLEQLVSRQISGAEGINIE